MAVSKLRKQSIIQHGEIASGGVSANSYKDISVTFPTPFPSIPTVVPCIYSGSTAPAMGRMLVALQSATETGCVLRVFNSDTADRNPTLKWIAVL